MSEDRAIARSSRAEIGIKSRRQMRPAPSKPASQAQGAGCFFFPTRGKMLIGAFKDLVAGERYRFSPHDPNPRYFLRSSA
jgi:hypothetical protein